MKNAGWMKFPRFWFPPILYSGIIFYTSSISHVKIPLQEVFLDKILHVFFYLPFGFLLARLVYRTGFAVSKNRLLGVVLWGSFLYGMSDEIHQAFVPGRSMELLDMAADTLGGLLGGLLYRSVLRMRKKLVQE